MKRRSFLTATTLASAGLGAFLITSCINNNKDKEIAEDANPGDALLFDLDEETINSLSQKFAAGTHTIEQVTQLYLDRILATDKEGPTLNSVIEINPEALDIAKKLDIELSAGKKRGPLHGIPVLIKDNIDTADKMQTTAGSLAMMGNIASEDAFVVKRLRAAGAVILGKTNLSEWANFRSTQSSSGWSSRGRQTKNPYIIDHSPCGSSAGSGVAVSANLCAVAVGTETDGSIVCPASVNGIVGIKPTVGLVSRSGIIPISATQDTAGPMARTVTDAALLLAGMVGEDDKDGVTLQSKGKLQTDYTKYLDKNGLVGKRIGIERKLQGTNPAINTIFTDSINLLKSLGATIVEIDYLDRISESGDAEYTVLQYEFKDGLNRYLAKANANVKSLKEVIDYNLLNRSKAMPYFNQEILDSSQLKGALTDQEYKIALNKSFEGSKAILDSVIKGNSLDAICGITMGPACSIDLIYGDKWGYSLTMPAAASGYPHITVPGGTVYDLPVGFSFFGLPYTEGALISMGYAYEQATLKRLKPKFKKAFLS